LNIFLHPPLTYNTEKIDFSEIENLSELHRPILTVTQERATIRDQFAMAALAGNWLALTDADGGNYEEWAYKVADKMLEARK